MRIKIYDEVFDVEKIQGMNVTLKCFDNTSAPHSHCVFFNKSSFKCDFPQDKEKKCTFTESKMCGWDTKEYIKVDVPEKVILEGKVVFLNNKAEE